MTEKIFGLIGRTLKHSWSVPIHHEMGCKSYQLIELEPEELGPFLGEKLIGGLNVTIPYKKAVIPYCASIDPYAEAIGSVNTLTADADGNLRGYNTDALGLSYIAKRSGISFRNAKVVILGSGGTSLTAQAVSRQEGAKKIIVISRSGEDNYTNLKNHKDADILINTTPVGMFPNNGESAVDLYNFPKLKGVLDVIYNPRRTALLMQAEQLGIPHCGGLPMLVAQAVAAEEKFFGKPIPENQIERIASMLQRNMTNIVLIGMPGSGKSVVGACLEEITGRTSIDIDAEIVKKAGCSIPEIFKTAGEDGFRVLESEIVREAGKNSGKIIITGGGVVTRPENYAPLHQNGRIYQLDRDLSKLPIEGRPLSQQTAPAELARRRAPLYESFRDFLVDNNGTVRKTAEMIWRDFNENNGD
jgi:shikimate dehydrogenase